jgi:hypothetical protein
MSSQRWLVSAIAAVTSGSAIAQRILGGVGEHDAEAKGVVEPVALVDTTS